MVDFNKLSNRALRRNSDFHDVGEFHEKFGLDNCTHHEPGPREVPADLVEFRAQFLAEELEETLHAMGFKGAMVTLGLRDIDAKIDHEKVFDGLIDLNYVSHGTAHLFGYPWAQGWAAVQRANMAKERAKEARQSARGSVWDVIKPAGWQPPDIKGLLERWGFRV